MLAGSRVEPEPPVEAEKKPRKKAAVIAEASGDAVFEPTAAA
jgi:hypothetical protein